MYSFSGSPSGSRETLEIVRAPLPLYVWYSGAIALALAFSQAGPHAGMIKAATFTVVIFTTLIFGSLTKWMIGAFKINSI